MHSNQWKVFSVALVIFAAGQMTSKETMTDSSCYPNGTCACCLKASVSCNDTINCTECRILCNKTCSDCLHNICNLDSGICDNCKAGQYGVYCNETCSKCNTLQCDRNGSCTNGCSETFLGENCDRCREGYYGSFCNSTCSFGCRHSKCDRTGHCSDGCKDGFKGSDCSEKEFSCYPKHTCKCCSKKEIRCNNTMNCTSCVDGYYGDDCRKQCPKECVSCDKNFTHTPKCYECVSGRYESTCAKSCPSTCLDERCYIQYGYCLNCTDGHFGDRCDQNCSKNCINGSCDGKTGHCFQCVVGFYGNFCNETCNDNCHKKKCNMDNGACQGCNIGYYGTFCNINCSKGCANNTCRMENGACHNCTYGYYGQYCNKTCLSCNGSICDRDNGSCILGCIGNFIDDKCENCKNGTYGVNCTLICPSNCHNSRCYRYNGTCVDGCNTGYSDSKFCCANSTSCIECSTAYECVSCSNGTYGNNCEQMCPVACSGSCNRNTGNCTACPNGLYGDTCTSCCQECQTSPRNKSCSVACFNDTTGSNCRTDVTRGSLIQGPESSRTAVGVAVGVTIVAVAAAVVTLAVVIFLNKRRQPNQHHQEEDLDVKTHGKSYFIAGKSSSILYTTMEPNYEQTIIETEIDKSEDSQAMEETKLDANNKIDYENCDRPSLKLSPTELCRSLAKTDEEYLDEFMNLPQGLIKSYTEAKKSKNAQRNRYNMIYPYDETRVKIDDKHSDYINASYIDVQRRKHLEISACSGR